MRVYIIRHGQTKWNVTYQLQGQTDIPLNEKGRALAEVTGAALCEVPFDAAYTSPLQRAKETAEIVLKAAAAGSGTVCRIIADERLREIGFGEMEGVRVRDAQGRLTDENFVRFFGDTEHYIPPRGGESFESLLRRTGDFLDFLRGRAREKDGRPQSGASVPETILISAHGAVSRALLANMTHCPLHDFWSGGVPKNCAVTIADLEDEEWKIKEKDILYYDNENIGF